VSHVDTVRAFYETVNGGGDPGEIAAMLREDVRWQRPPDVPITGTLEGREKVRQMFAAFGESLERFEIEPGEMEQVGEAIVVPVTFRGSPRDGRAFAFAGTQVFTVKDGAITSVSEFKTVEEGRAAASESGDGR
jgi:ketosteroid isomerase-like protein